MPRIKHTKTELKAQRDALWRFKRYLPTLQLKKQQLQVEVRQLDVKIEERKINEKRTMDDLASWIRMFAEPIDLSQYLKVKEIKTGSGNIAGVNIPILESVEFDRAVPDLFETPPWIDEGLDALERIIQLRVELEIMGEQRRLLAEELRTTTQRVNLFEKVKIPECQDNIRVIRIFLGDEQTNDVVRGKIAKGRSVEKIRSA